MKYKMKLLPNRVVSNTKNAQSDSVPARAGEFKHQITARMWGRNTPYLTNENKMRTKLIYKLLKYNTFNLVICLTFDSKYVSL